VSCYTVLEVTVCTYRWHGDGVGNTVEQNLASSF